MCKTTIKIHKKTSRTIRKVNKKFLAQLNKIYLRNKNSKILLKEDKPFKISKESSQSKFTMHPKYLKLDTFSKIVPFK